MFACFYRHSGKHTKSTHGEANPNDDFFFQGSSPIPEAEIFFKVFSMENTYSKTTLAVLEYFPFNISLMSYC